MKREDKIGLLLAYNGCLWMTNLMIGANSLYGGWGLGLDQYIIHLGGLI